MSLNFNVDPYYDDFDPTKNFHRILFKPGYAVQARELTQSQTILQDQISKFGTGIYNDGSKVSGANIFVDTKIVTVKLTSASATNITSYVGQYVVGQTSKFIAQVISVDDVNYYLKTKAVNIENNQKFTSDETLYFYNTKIDALSSLTTNVTPQHTDVVATSVTYTRNATGTYLDTSMSITTGNISVGDTISISSIGLRATVISITDINNLVLNKPLPQDITNVQATITNEVTVNALEVGIDEGVWFTNGCFVRNAASSIIPDALNSYPSVVVGFEVEENILDSYDDSSLLDPAIGASNYQAPGADRYQVTLNLVAKPYVSDQTVANLTSSKFIELVRISAGVIQNINNVPVFSAISKQIAQSVSDVSGDFVVNPYNLIIGNSATTANTINATISAGKVYFNGSPIEHISRTPYVLEKARDTESLIDQDISTYYGDYTTIKNIKGTIINFQQGTQVELHNVAFGEANSHTVIGTARVRNFDYDSGSGVNSEHKAFLFDVSLTNTTGQSFANVASMIIPNAGNYTTPTFSANTVSPTTLVDGNYNSLIFPMPQENISNVSSVNYVTHRYYYAPTLTNGVVTINTSGANETFVGGTGAISGAQRQINYMVVAQTTNGAYTAGTYIPMDQSNVSITITNSPGTPQATFNIAGGYNGAATIMATISVVSDNIKNKVLNANTAVLVSANTLNTSIDLGKSDIYKFRGVYEIGNTNSWQGTWASGTTYSANNVALYADGNVYISLVGTNTNHAPNTSPTYWSAYTNNIANYLTDDGQKDAYYDHGTIKNISGSAKGNVAVVFDYFTHSGGQGFFTADSYTVDYADIPSFTSPQYGSSYNLRDVLDFRPRRTDGIGATGFDNYQLTAPLNNAFVDYGYYLGRTDKIVLYPNGQFKTIRGISSYVNPTTPSDISDALTVFTVNYPPYTFDKKDIVVTSNNTRRYTMRDIGLLDKRISNLEYYTSLSLLEKQVTGSDVTDSTGLNIQFKNGFLVDSFKGQGVGDVLNADYAAAVDFNKQFARPTFVSNVASYSVDTNQGVFSSSKTNNYLTLNNNIITFSYNEKPLIYQNVATEIINVNPFNVINFVGTVKLSPSSDVWYDNKTQPNINIVNEDQAAWLAAVNGTGNGSQWNDWEICWTGEDPINVNDQGQVSRDTQAITNAITTKGLSSSVSGGNIQVSSTTKILSDSIVPYARNIPIKFEIFGMAPYTTLHTFMDSACVDYYVVPDAGYSTGLYNIDITDAGTGYSDGNNQSIITISGANTVPAYVTANVSGGQIVKIDILSTGAGYISAPTITVSGSNTHTAVLTANMSSFAGATLITDINGYASGTINLPNDEFVKIPSGAITIEFADNFISPVVGKAYAKSSFYAKGTLQTTQTTVVSTRPPRVYSKPQVVVDDYIPPQPAVAPLEYYTNDVLNPGSSSYAVGSDEQNQYINAFVNNLGQTYWGYSDIKYNPNTVNDAYNNDILPTLQTYLPSGYTTPTGTMALAATTYVLNQMHVYSIQNQGILSDASLLAMAIEDLKTVCQNSTNLEDTAISYVTGAAHDQYKSAQSAAEKCIQNGTDPLSQNFYVDAKTYPNGLFVSSVDLFFATKDATIPVNVRIRPTVNGYPDASNDIPGSLVFKNPSEVTVPAGSVTSAIGSATNFAFDYPIYLQPGQYTLMIATNSDQYTMYASKLGQVQYGTNNTVSQLNYLGSLFKSQNSSTWVAAPGETLAFNMNICDFSGGTAVVDITSETSGEVDYDLMKLTTNDMTFTGLDSINYSVLTRKLSDNSQSTSNVVANQNYNFSTRQKQSSSGDITVRATLTNTDRWTSPVIDLERLNTILVTNNISTYSSADTVAESLGGIGYGTASARYITRRITLNNNFDSTGLTVFMDVNRQPGTKIEVYYKVMNALDNNNFDDQSYVLMNPILTPESGVGYTGPSDWISDTYQSLGITYNDITTGVTYDNFKVFAIKVVFYSDNPSFVPQIKNFRTVATA